MDKVLHWIKSNIPIVVLGAVMVITPIVAFIFAGRWNRSIAEEAQARARKLTEIEAIGKTNVQLVVPGGEPIAFTGPVNRYILDEYKRVSDSLQGDSTAVSELALAHNRGTHAPLIPRLFPEMPAVERDTLPPEMYEAVLQAYRSLLDRIQAADPMPAGEVAQRVIQREEDYISGTLRKKSRSELEPSELADLTSELTKARLAKYGERALNKRVYLSLESLPLPSPALKASATEGEMFAWQWNYWLVEDILHALDDANREVAGADGRIATNPVKHVLWVRPLDGLSFGGSGVEGAGTGAPGAGSGRRVPRYGGLGAGGGTLGAPGGAQPADPDTGAPMAPASGGRDYSSSLTGRTSNSLYDVRLAEVKLVARADRLPAIFDALARRNFLTVLDVDLRPADPFVAAAAGFIYGSDPVVEVTMVIESVWLRAWTVPLMPKQVRDHLKIPSTPTPGSESGDGSETPSE
jgi:hypothetical protein